MWGGAAATPPGVASGPQARWPSPELPGCGDAVFQVLGLTQVVAGGVCFLDEQVSGSRRDLKHLDVTLVGMWGDKTK